MGNLQQADHTHADNSGPKGQTIQFRFSGGVK
jgi:hypothetical protein